MIAPTLCAVQSEFLLGAGSLYLLMAGVFAKANPFRLVMRLAILFLIAVMALAFLAKTGAAPVFAGQFMMDGFAGFMKATVALGGALALLMTVCPAAREGLDKFEYPVLVLLSVLGMMLMVSAGDFISLWLGIELQALPLYVLAGFQRNNPRAAEASVKYFVLGALASCLLLYGISLVYGAAGSTSFLHIESTRSVHAMRLAAGLVFVMAGLAFKVSAAPFHMWTPDVYEGAPTPVAAFYALAPKVAALAVLARLVIGPFAALFAQVQVLLITLAVLSILLGAFAALGQTNFKRLMAYSAIGNMGYALLGLAVGGFDGIRALMIYAALYMVMTAGAFAALLALEKDGRSVEDIADLSGLSRKSPLVAACMAVAMFGLAGIPPLAGFFGKFYVFMAVVHAGFVPLAVLGVMASVVAAYYYLRVVKVMYFDEPAEGVAAHVGPELGLALAVSTGITVAFCVVQGFLLSAAGKAAASLLAG